MLLPGMAVLTGLAVGCQAPPQPTAPTRATVTLGSPEDFEYLWESAEQTLLRYAFRLDRRDRVEGVITTHRETSAHWFEWWRPQPRPAYHWAESTLHTVGHRATLTITRLDESSEYEVDVEVDRYRYTMEERQVDNSAATFRLYSNAVPTESGKLLTAEESSRWIPDGRNERMERAILEDVLARYRRGVAVAGM